MRINLDDWWYSHNSRAMLMGLLAPKVADVRLLGHLVDGIWQAAMKLAQPYWLKGKRLIPESDWQMQFLPEELFTVGLAERRPDGIYVFRTEEQYRDYLAANQTKQANGKQRMRGVERDEKGRVLPRQKKLNLPDPAPAGQDSSRAPAPAGPEPVSDGQGQQVLDGAGPRTQQEPVATSSGQPSFSSSSEARAENEAARAFGSNAGAPVSARSGSGWQGGLHLAAQKLDPGIDFAEFDDLRIGGAL